MVWYVVVRVAKFAKGDLGPDSRSSYTRLKKWPKNGAKNSNFEKKKKFWENDRDDMENTGFGVSGTFGTFRFSGRDVSKMTLGEFSPQDLVKFSSW